MELTIKNIKNESGKEGIFHISMDTEFGTLLHKIVDGFFGNVSKDNQSQPEDKGIDPMLLMYIKMSEMMNNGIKKNISPFENLCKNPSMMSYFFNSIMEAFKIIATKDIVEKTKPERLPNEHTINPTDTDSLNIDNPDSAAE